MIGTGKAALMFEEGNYTMYVFMFTYRPVNIASMAISTHMVPHSL
jgi:hypothetical protein